MVMWIVVSSILLSGVYTAIGGPKLIQSLLGELPGGRWIVIILMQFVLQVLGCFLDPGGIILICVPIFLPVVVSLGFDPIWFGVLFIMNMEMAFLTPPVGANLFYMRGVTSEKDITIMDIYKAALPFVVLQAVTVVIVMVFPQLVLWLPSTMK